MTKLVAKFRIVVGALALLVMAIAAQPAAAQQPTSVNPQASAVKEDQLFQELNRISGRCTLPDQKACTIEQPAGRDWRHFHEVTLRWIGGIVISAFWRYSSSSISGAAWCESKAAAQAAPSCASTPSSASCIG